MPDVTRTLDAALIALRKAGYAVKGGKSQLFISRPRTESKWLKVTNDTVSEMELKTLLRAVGCGYL